MALSTIGVMFAPYVYNYHLFPLARLHKTIGIGDSCDEVSAKFQAYHEKYKNASQIYFNEGMTETEDDGSAIEPSRFLALYHVNIFDDIQLNLVCDANGDVSKIQFIGD